jgi:hypothetical protein
MPDALFQDECGFSDQGLILLVTVSDYRVPALAFAIATLPGPGTYYVKGTQSVSV